MKKRDFFRNIITGLGGQFLVIILGVIIPRIMITTYGSDVNGVVSTTTQIFSYLALLEAGIGQSARIALYKPISENNHKEISKVVTSAEAYFRKITWFYGIGVILFSVILPLVIKSEVDYFAIFMIVLLEGLSGVISFFFIQTPTVLLYSDGKGYINNLINLVNKILGYSSKIILAYMGVSIIFVQLAYFVITVLKVVFYRIYLRKRYSWICKKEKTDFSLLKDKKSYLITEIAWTIFSSTDMIVLSVFLSTKLSSVYSVYNIIFSNLNLLLNAVGGSILYVLGQLYHKDIHEYEKVHDSFNTIFLCATTILMSVCCILSIPFIKLYTTGVTDIDYIYPQLPVMYALVQMLSWSRYIPGNLTGVAGYAKQTSYISLIEAITNLSLSIIFVNKFGIVGVTLATVIALPIKVIWCTYIADKKVMKRSYWKSISIIGVNFLFFFGVVFLSRLYQPTISSYGQFFVWGLMLTIIFGIAGMGLNFLVNKDCWQVIRKYILKR